MHKQRSTLLNRIRWAVSLFLVTSFDYGVTRRLNFGLSGDVETSRRSGSPF